MKSLVFSISGIIFALTTVAQPAYAWITSAEEIGKLLSDSALQQKIKTSLAAADRGVEQGFNLDRIEPTSADKNGGGLCVQGKFIKRQGALFTYSHVYYQNNICQVRVTFQETYQDCMDGDLTNFKITNVEKLCSPESAGVSSPNDPAIKTKTVLSLFN